MTFTANDVTVGISTMNRPDALARCLDAILAGTAPPYEIIVVDQGALSSAAAVVQQRTARYPRLRHVVRPSGGLSAARNAIFAEAARPIVAVTDDDCVPDSNWVSAIVATLNRQPRPDAVTGPIVVLPATPDRPSSISPHTGGASVDYVGVVVVPWQVETGANFAALRAFVLAVGGYDERLGAGSPGQAAEDVELLLRLLHAGARIRYAPEIIVSHARESTGTCMSTRWSHGHGIGAVAGMLWRGRSRLSLRLMSEWTLQVGRRLAKAGLAADPAGVREGAVMLAAAARGLAYGRRVARRGRP